MYALPRRHSESPAADGTETVGCASAGGTIASHDGCVHLRPGSGGSQSGAYRPQIFSRRSEVMLQSNALLTPSAVSFTLNGETVVCQSGQTILEAAQQHDVEIPRLCYMEGMRPDGNCRTCMVEIKGERVLAPSCCRYPKEGMEVISNSARALTSQKMSIELLLSDVPETSYTL